MIKIKVNKPRANRRRQNVSIGSSQVLSRTEVITEINFSSSTAVAGGVLQINPANQALFPWLSSISAAYRMYKFLNLSFTYKPTCSTFKNGQIIYYFNEDDDLLPTSISEAKMCQPSAQQNVIRELKFNVPKSSLNRLSKYYIRHIGAVDDNEATDPRLHDIGYFGWFGQGDIGNAGTILVNYKVQLLMPKTIQPNPVALAQPRVLNTAFQNVESNATNPPSTSNNISTLLSNTNIGISEANTVDPNLLSTFSPWLEGLTNVLGFSNDSDSWRIRFTFKQPFCGAINLRWPVRLNYGSTPTSFPTLTNVLTGVVPDSVQSGSFLSSLSLIPIAAANTQGNSSTQQTFGIGGNIYGDFEPGDSFYVQLKTFAGAANYTFGSYFTYDTANTPSTTDAAAKRYVFSLLLIPMVKSFLNTVITNGSL